MTKKGEPLNAKTRRHPTLGVMYRIQRYHLRIKYKGVLYFVCPICGYINMRRVIEKHYVVRCVDCDAKFVVKTDLLLLPAGGRRTIPPDFIIPDNKGPTTIQEAFPMGDMGYWRQGGCVHGMLIEKETETEKETEK